MSVYMLNDIGFTPGKVEELPIDFSVENTMNKDEINEQSQKIVRWVKNFLDSLKNVKRKN